MKLNGLQKAGLKVLGIEFHEGGRTDSRRRSRLGGGQPQDHRKTLTTAKRKELIKRSRIINSNSPVALEARTTLADYAVGNGSRPIAQTEDQDWNEAAQALFMQWAKRPTICRRYSLAEVERMTSFALDVDGELFAHKTRDTWQNPALQLFESHRLSSHTEEMEGIYDGIKYAANGRPMVYFIDTKTPKNPRSPDRGIRAAHMLHVHDPQNFSSSRAVPAWANGLLGEQDRLEILAGESQIWKSQAEIAHVLESNREQALEDGDFGFDDDDDAIAGTDEATISAVLGGKVIRLDQGETLSTPDANRPGSEFQSAQMILAGGMLGGHLPPELILDASKIGGASVRLITSKADRKIKHRKQVIDSRLLDGCWFYVIGAAIDRGDLDPFKGWSNVGWTRPRSITVDAGRDSQQARADLEMGRKLWSDDIGEGGNHFDAHWRKRAKEAARIQAIADEEGVPVEALYKPERTNAQNTRVTE